MNTFLDLLIVVVLALAAVSLVAMVLMFLVKNRKVSQVCFWIIAALGIYMGYVGLRIMWVNSIAQSALAVLMALTAIAPFRPRRWRGAILPMSAVVRFDVLEAQKRPAMADADARKVDRVRWVEVRSEPSISHRILFDPGHGMDERLTREQFV